MKKRYYLLPLVVLLVVWAITEGGKPSGPDYGNLITIMDKETAGVFGAEDSGVYVESFKDGRKLVPAAGLKKTWEGITNADGKLVLLGIKTTFKQMKRSPLGIAILVIAPLSIIGVVVQHLIMKSRKTKQVAQTTNSDNTQREG